MDKETENNNNIYCPICHGQVEKTGKPDWALCPAHGWIKYKTQNEQERTDIFSKINLKEAFLALQAKEKIAFIRNKSTIIIFIISAVFVTVLLGFLLEYFALKSPTHKNFEMTSLKGPIRKEESVQSAAPVQPKEAVSLGETAKTEKETKEKSLQPQKPSKALFTVQVGAFSNVSYAKSLKMRLHKKGYNASITISKSKKDGRLYKVWIGKFRDREKAETIAAQIKREEGMQTFVVVLPK